MDPSEHERAAARKEDDSAENRGDLPVSGWVAFSPAEECPDAESIERALSRRLDAPIEVRGAENRDGERDDVPWVFAFELPESGTDVVIWAQRAVRDAFAGDPELHAMLDACPWVVRMQAPLGTKDPVADHFMLTGMLAAVMPDAPAILDASSDLIFDRRQLEMNFLAETAQPLERRLWSVEAAPSAAAGADSSEASEGSSESPPRVTLRTKGLARCHRPELEIADLPIVHLEAALTLLQSIASIVLELDEAPSPGLIEVGHDLLVHYAPIEGTEETESAAGEKGGAEPPPPPSPRARIGEPGPSGTAPTALTWPRQAIERIESGRAALVVTARAAHELREASRRTFGDFATAWGAMRRSADPALRAEAERSFFILAPVDPGGTQEVPEHAWFRVSGFEGTMIRAALLDAPLRRDDLSAGAIMLISNELVRGWRVELSGRTFGPEHAPALLAEVDRLRGVS